MTKKSHYGCYNCKKRRVKCDEQKPKCIRCEKRRETCHYDYTLPSSNSTDVEVRLMYQWTTSTCNSMGRDHDFVQKKVPLLAFKHSFLMDALFMMSAAHLFHETGEEEYLRIRSLYHGKATSGLRAEIAKGVSEENCEAIMFASSTLSIYVMILDYHLEEHGLIDQWLSMFLALGEIFKSIQPFIHVSSLFGTKSSSYPKVPSGEVYLPQIERVYKKQKENLTLYHPAVVYLAQITELVLTSPGDVDIRAVFRWPFKLRELKALITERDPCALVLLARFFYLLSLVRGVWFFENYSLICYNDIKALIPSDWLEYVELL